MARAALKNIMFSRNMYCNFSYLFWRYVGLSTDYKIYEVPVLNYHQVNDEKHSALDASC